MSLRQRFLIKNVQRRAFDSAFGKSAHNRFLVNHWPASHIDDHRRRLHRRELRLTNHSARFCRQRSSNHDVVSPRNHLHAFFRPKNFIDQRIYVRGVSLQREHFHSQRPHSHRNCPPNVSISNDANRLSFCHRHVKRFPPARHLVPNHPAKVLREVKNRAHCEFAERRAEHTAPIRELHGTFTQFRKQCSLEAHRPRVNPLQIRTHRKHFPKQLQRSRPVTQNPRVRGHSRKRFRGISHNNFRSHEFLRQDFELRLVRVRQNQYRLVFHEHFIGRRNYITQNLTSQKIHSKNIPLCYSL